jgi:hypothetical protein
MGKWKVVRDKDDLIGEVVVRAVPSGKKKSEKSENGVSHMSTSPGGS